MADFSAGINPRTAAHRPDAACIKPGLKHVPSQARRYSQGAKADEAVMEGLPVRRAHSQLCAAPRPSHLLTRDVVATDEGDEFSGVQPQRKGKGFNRNRFALLTQIAEVDQDRGKAETLHVFANPGNPPGADFSDDPRKCHLQAVRGFCQTATCHAG